MSENAPFGTVTTCRSCGNRILAAADVCPRCGVRQRGSAASDLPPPSYAPLSVPEHGYVPVGSVSEKRIVPTLLFWLLLGVFGAHRFYVRRPASAVAQLLTLGGLGIWWLIDLILILTESFRDGEGRTLREWM